MSHGLMDGCQGIGDSYDSHDSQDEIVQTDGRLSPDYAELAEAGLNQRVQALVASDCISLIIGLSPGHRHDAPRGRELLRRLGPASHRPSLVMDRAYEDDATRRLALELGYRAVVPTGSNRRHLHHYDRDMYHRRYAVERFHRIDTRCDKLDSIFLAAIHLVLIYDMLNSM